MRNITTLNYTMDKTEAYKIAQYELSLAEEKGFEESLYLVGGSAQKDVSGISGTTYDVELSYVWANKEH
jgi:hypothetical protein